METWDTVERPSQIGKKKKEKHREWNDLYGEGNWRLAWKVGGNYVGFLDACRLYQDAYFVFLNNNPDVLNRLVKEASNVYDDSITNISSGFNYPKQETDRTHIQDIAIRKVLSQMNIWFEGDEIIQIRHDEGSHPLSMMLSPGKVPFHRQDMIEQPELRGWWDSGSVESFWQSNKYLQVKRESVD